MGDFGRLLRCVELRFDHREDRHELRFFVRRELVALVRRLQSIAVAVAVAIPQCAARVWRMVSVAQERFLRSTAYAASCVPCVGALCIASRCTFAMCDCDR